MRRIYEFRDKEWDQVPNHKSAPNTSESADLQIEGGKYHKKHQRRQDQNDWNYKYARDQHLMWIHRHRRIHIAEEEFIIDIEQSYPRMPYVPRQNRDWVRAEMAKTGKTVDEVQTKYPMHFGQRKLHLSEVDFLNLTQPMWSKHDEIIVVYVGAGDGFHIPLLLEWYSKCPTKMHFHLYDDHFCYEIIKYDSAFWHRNNMEKSPQWDSYVKPKHIIMQDYNAPKPTSKSADANEIAAANNLYNVAAADSGIGNTRLAIYQRYFGDDDAARYGACKIPILFISDIRYMALEKDDLEEMNRFITADMDMQRRWCSAMSPMQAMLKFKMPLRQWLPQPDGTLKLDHTFKLPKTVSYFSGRMRVQAWVGEFSTETRLITDCKSDTAYDPIKHEEQMYHFNVTKKYAAYSAEKSPRPYCRCFNCTFECYILREYAKIAADWPHISKLDIISLGRELSARTRSIDIYRSPTANAGNL
jgi:hypothetical protein